MFFSTNNFSNFSNSIIFLIYLLLLILVTGFQVMNDRLLIFNLLNKVFQFIIYFLNLIYYLLIFSLDFLIFLLKFMRFFTFKCLMFLFYLRNLKLFISDKVLKFYDLFILLLQFFFKFFVAILYILNDWGLTINILKIIYYWFSSFGLLLF